MRVIAGIAGGIRLETPSGRDVRPTRDSVRESLFNILMPRIAGARFLDLFAGTGANGIEALSRGADFCTFVEEDPRIAGLIRRNLKKARLAEKAEVIRRPLPAALGKLGNKGVPYDIVFADPPYEGIDYGLVFQALRESCLAAPESIVILEHRARAPIPEELCGYHRTRLNIYGETGLSFFA